MSIRLMTQVWDNSKQDGTNLLLLLAIADFANDDGTAWPSIDTLANKTRMSRRNVQYLIGQLEEAGELTVEVNAGPHGCNLYRVQTVSPVQNSDAKLHPSKAKGVQSSSTGGAKQRRQIAHEPSGTVIDPSGENHQESAPTPEKTQVSIPGVPADPAEHMLACQAQKGQRSYTIPGEAGGATPLGDELLAIFCVKACVSPAVLGDRKTQEWAGELEQIARIGNATPRQAVRALRALVAEDSELAFKVYATPFQRSFRDDYELYLARELSGAADVIRVGTGRM